MRPLDKYKAAGTLVLDLDFTGGSIQDRSGQGNDPYSIAAGLRWNNDGGGRGWHFEAGETHYIKITGNASLQGTEGTFIMLCSPIRTQYINQTFFDHGAGTGTRVNLLCNGAALQLYDGTVSPSVTADFKGKRMVCVRFKDGEPIDVFLDGTFVGSSAANSAIPTSPTGNLDIGGYDYYPAGCDATVHRVIKINDGDVTDAEIAAIWEDYSRAKKQGTKKPTGYRAAPAQKDEDGLVFATDMKVRDGRVSDTTGAIAPTATVLKPENMVQCLGPGGMPALENRGDGWITLGDRDLVTGGNMTVTAWVRLRSSAQYETVVGKSYGTFSWQICGNADNRLRFWVGAANDSARAVSDSVLTDNLWHRIVCTYDKTLASANVKMYVDGVLQAQTANVQVDVPNTGDHEVIGAQGGAGEYALDGALADIRVYGVTKDAAWVRADYLPGARSVAFDGRLDPCAGTYALTLARRIGDTPWSLMEAGSTYLVQDSTGRRSKWIYTNSASIIYAPARHSYGTWHYRIKMATIANENSVGLLASARGGYASLTGYVTYVWPDGSFGILRCTGGGSAGVLQTAAGAVSADVEYEVCATRALGGVFKLYIRGGAYSAWTLLGTSAADTTYSAARYYTAYIESGGGRFGGLIHYQGVLDPTAGELPEG